MKNRHFITNSLIVLVSFVVAVLLCELLLIVIQWSPQKTTSEYLQFGYSTGVPVWDEDGILEEARPVRVKLFEYDEELFWRTIPNTDFTNAQGFRGSEDVSVGKSASVVRILILGDSCSFLGRTLYTDFLREKLRQDQPNTTFEIINASVPGYTSFQGKKLLQELLKYQPQYVCIYFGWNDHWILPSGYSDQYHYELIQGLKVMQMARILWAKALGMRDYRVPLENYRKNLVSMVETLQNNQIIPVLIAAPAGYSDQGMPQWAYQFYREYYRMTADEIRQIPQTHQAYARVLSDVAQQYRAVFVDAQDYFEKLSPSLNMFFRNDLIHLTDKGHEAMAESIVLQILQFNASRNITWDQLAGKNIEK